MRKEPSTDLRDLRPKWNRKWEKSEKGYAVILIPKFGEHLFGKWIRGQMKQPYYRLKLDEIGSFVWEHCNGMDEVQEIGEKLRKKFGDRVEPVQERLALFFKQLERSKSITWV